MALWNVPPIWEGESCYILGGGPSLKDFDPEPFRNSHIIAVNNTHTLVPWAEFMFFMDSRWYAWNFEKLRKFEGIIITHCEKFEEVEVIKYLIRGRKRSFPQRTDTIMNGRNAGHAAICIALLLGAKKIYLLGFDMRKIDGENNYHQEHKRTIEDNIYEDQYIPLFEPLKVEAQERRAEIINATPDSALKTFPIISHNELMETLK